MAKNMPVPNTRTLNVTNTMGIHSIILSISRRLLDTIHREAQQLKTSQSKHQYEALRLDSGAAEIPQGSRMDVSTSATSSLLSATAAQTDELRNTIRTYRLGLMSGTSLSA